MCSLSCVPIVVNVPTTFQPEFPWGLSDGLLPSPAKTLPYTQVLVLPTLLPKPAQMSPGRLSGSAHQAKEPPNPPTWW